MTPPARRPHRRLVWAGGVFAVLAVGAFFARAPLADWGVGALLEMLGATRIRLRVVAASPWRLELRDVSFNLRAQTFAAGTVSIARAHWWTPSLGAVRVREARVRLKLDDAESDPWNWSTYRGRTARLGPLKVPLEEFSGTGWLTVQAAGVSDRELAATVALRRTGANRLAGTFGLEGEGLATRGELSVGADGDVGFTVADFALEVAPWQDVLQRLVLPPGGPASLGGHVTGRGSGRVAGKRWQVGGTLALRDGRYRHPTQPIAADGVEFDLELLNQPQFATRPGALRIRELRTGRLALHDFAAGFALESAGRIVVDHAGFRALGGTATVEPFHYAFAGRGELDVTIVPAGLDLGAVLALAPNVAASGSGRVDGHLPLRIDGGGVRFSPGWLALAPGAEAELKFTAPGLLTRGMATTAADYVSRRQIENGLRRLPVTTLRLDIRPEEAPRGCTAILRLAGVDGVAPVSLELNVSQPVEKLVDLDSRARP